MARITITQDDMTGEDLTETVEPTKVTVDGQDYEVDLGPASKEHFIKWLSHEGPYALRSTAAPRQAAKTAQRDADREDKANARRWAIETGFEFPSATEKQKNGKPVMKKLGDRGRVPEAVMKAWKDAGSPVMGE